MIHKRFLAGLAAVALAFFATASPSIASPLHDLHLNAALAYSVDKVGPDSFGTISDLTIVNADTMLAITDAVPRCTDTAAVQANDLLIDVATAVISCTKEGLPGDGTETIAVG